MLRAIIFAYFKGCEMHSSSRLPWAPRHLNPRTFLPVAPEQMRLPVTHVFLSRESLYLRPLQARRMHWIGVLTSREKWCHMSRGTRGLCAPAGAERLRPGWEGGVPARGCREVAAVRSWSRRLLLVAVSFCSWEGSLVIALKNEYCHRGEMKPFQILFLRKSLVDILFSQ